MHFLSSKRLFRLTEILCSVVAACLVVVGSSAQQASPSSANWAGLLTQLRSSDSEVRSEALDQLRSDPAALRDPKVRAALINQLDRENQETFSAEEEDYASYVSWLSDTVAKVVDWKDPRKVCILANAADIPDELADHAKIAVPCLLRRLRNAHAFQGDVMAALVQALEKGRHDLDPATIQAVKHATFSALRDPDASVRAETVDALAKFGEADMIPALRVVAETDPDPTQHYAIREWAAKAIVAIEQRIHPARITVNPIRPH
jgi:hypothetical protein